MQVQGYCHPKFSSVQPLFEQLWQGIEVGAALSLYHRGERVIDLWGGYKDRERTQHWQQDTLVNTYSITKGVVAAALAVLVETGQLNYEQRVCHYWPEFSKHGKDQLTVGQLLSHQGGLCGIETPLTVEDLFDWEKMIHLLEQQPPLWPPGQAAGYHPITWGYLSGELIRRITGSTPGEFIQTQFCEPLSLNFYLGVPDDKHSTCATLVGPNHARNLTLQPEKPNKKAQTTNAHVDPALFDVAQKNPIISPFKHASSPAWRRAEIPASNGHSDARSLAKFYGALANNGEMDDIRLLHPDTIKAATRVAIDHQIDQVMGHVIRRSQGGFILSHDNNYGAGNFSFGHAGAGGSMAFADPEANLGFAYVMNQLQSDGYPKRYGEILAEIYHCLSNSA